MMFPLDQLINQRMITPPHLFPLPPSPQTPAAAEPHAGLLPAGQPAQHGVRVHAHLRDLRAGARRGRLPLHGLRLAGDLRLLGRGEGERDIFRCWEDRERVEGKREASDTTKLHDPRHVAAPRQSVYTWHAPPLHLRRRQAPSSYWSVHKTLASTARGRPERLSCDVSERFISSFRFHTDSYFEKVGQANQRHR